MMLVFPVSQGTEKETEKDTGNNSMKYALSRADHCNVDQGNFTLNRSSRNTLYER